MTLGQRAGRVELEYTRAILSSLVSKLGWDTLTTTSHVDESPTITRVIHLSIFSTTSFSLVPPTISRVVRLSLITTVLLDLLLYFSYVLLYFGL